MEMYDVVYAELEKEKGMGQIAPMGAGIFSNRQEGWVWIGGVCQPCQPACGNFDFEHQRCEQFENR
jgi:hypothetical protein